MDCRFGTCTNPSAHIHDASPPGAFAAIFARK
jgi:hypothetical protein